MAAPNGRAVAGSGLEFIKWGLPMVVLVVSAPFGLSYLTQEKITQHDLRTRIKKEDEANVFGERRLFNLEEEYFRLQKMMDGEDWENVRVPRPPTRRADEREQAAAAAAAAAAAIQTGASRVITSSNQEIS